MVACSYTKKNKWIQSEICLVFLYGSFVYLLFFIETFVYRYRKLTLTVFEGTPTATLQDITRSFVVVDNITRSFVVVDFESHLALDHGLLN